LIMLWPARLTPRSMEIITAISSFFHFHCIAFDGAVTAGAHGEEQSQHLAIVEVVLVRRRSSYPFRKPLAPVEYDFSMPSRLFSVILTTLLCNGECVQVGAQEYCRVELVAFDANGVVIPNVGIDVIEAGPRRMFKSTFHGNVGKKLPFGVYTLRVSAPGFRQTELEVRLYQRELKMRVPLALSIECGGFATLRGSVRPAPRDRELWLKLVPILGSGGSETPVGRDGHFVAGGFDNGTYLMVLLDGTSPIYTETIQVFGEKGVTLNLK
jgi:hypothetical protein